jgi:hypothetical protein
LRTRAGIGTHWRGIAAVAVIAAAVRAPLLPLHAYRWGGGTDTSEYKGWMQAIHERGILEIFRTSSTDYVGYHWVLWLLTLIWERIGDSYSDTAPGLHLLVKAPPLLFDAGLFAAVYVVTCSLVSEREDVAGRAAALALGAAAVVALHPAVVYDSAVWGQIDALTALTMLLPLFLVVRRHHAAAGFVWGVGFVMKPQPIVIAPLLAVLAFDRGDGRAFLRLTAGGLAAGLLLTMPWIAHGDLRRIGGIYKALAYQDLGRLSGNAWNLWWFRDVAADARPGDRIIDGLPLTYRTAGTLLTGVAGLLTLVYAWARPSLTRALVAGAYAVFAFYMFSVSSHDRYLYPLFALLLPVTAADRRWLWLFVPLSVTFTLTLLISAPPSEGWAHDWLESPLSVAGASVNLLSFAAYTGVLAKAVARDLRNAAREGWAAIPAAGEAGA